MDAVAELENFSLAIGNKRIYVDASLKIPASGCTVLMGPSGTGKSTLLRTFAGVVQQHPEVRMGGVVKVRGLSETGEVLAHAPVLVGQKAEFLLASVWEVLVAHWPDRSKYFRVDQKKFIQAYLAELGQADLFAAIDQSLLDVSAEARRRIGIVSKSLAPTALLMVDEPTANLKDGQTEGILALIKLLSQRMPLLVITHNQRHARVIADHVILVASGRVQESAPVDAFFNHPQSESAQAFVRSGSCPEEPLECLAEDEPDDAPSPPTRHEPSVAAPALTPEEEEPALDRCFAGLGQSAERWLQKRAHADAQGMPPPASRKVIKYVRQTQVNLSPILGSESVPLPLKPRNRIQGRGPRGFAWLFEGELAGTPKPGIIGDTGQDLQDLRDAGITHVLSLTEVPFPPREAAEFDLSCSALPMPDMEAPSLTEAIGLSQWIDQLLQEGHSIAVHCKAGLGRTGTILAMYAIWRTKGEINAAAAIAKIRGLNAGMIQSVAQETFLERFAQRIKDWAEESEQLA